MRRRPRKWLIRKQRTAVDGRPWELWTLIGDEYRRVARRSTWKYCVQTMLRLEESQ